MKKFISYLVILLLVISLASCGRVVDDPNNDNEDIENPIIKPDEGDKPDKPIIDTNVEFSVSLVYNKKVFIPEKGDEVKAVWADDYSQYTETISSDGYAKKKLDGVFHVYLTKAPNGYSYNPNIYTADNENPTVVIELFKIARIAKGQGTALQREYEMSTTGVYRAEIKKALQRVYYAFHPTKAGYYVLETMVNVYDDTVNPKVDIYNGNAGGFRTLHQEGLDSGGTSIPGGFTKNVKWVVKLTEEMIGNLYIFAIYADSKSGVYPINVDFAVSYEGEYYIEDTVSKLMVAEEIFDYKVCNNCIYPVNCDNTPDKCPYCGSTEFSNKISHTPDFDLTKFTYINSNGGTGNYYNNGFNGSSLIIGAGFRYNEETKFWHVYDNSTNTYGPALCVKITQPCAYYEESLNQIESHGNKNLTVENGTENYKKFIEQTYAAVCNSDGVCFVTMEMKEFLQKFSVSQRLFFDGNGFVETTGVYATEEDQWLFACGYYKMNE